MLLTVAALMLGCNGDDADTSPETQAKTGTTSSVTSYELYEGKTVDQFEDERLGSCSAEKLFKPSGVIGLPEVIYFVDCNTDKYPLYFRLGAETFDDGEYAGSVRFAGASAVHSGRGYEVDLSCSFFDGRPDCEIPRRIV